MGEKIAVILPAYNEEDVIRERIERVEGVMSRRFDDLEIIPVNDGSGDRTGHILRQEGMKKGYVSPVIYERNRGKMNAIKEGFEEVGGDVDYVLFLDADMEIDAGRIDDFMGEIAGAAGVMGTKQHPDSYVEYPARRVIISRVVSFIVEPAFDLPVNDPLVGMKLFRKDALERVLPLVQTEGAMGDIELLLLMEEKGFDVTQAPVTIEFRGNSESDGVFSMLRALLEVAEIFYRSKAGG